MEGRLDLQPLDELAVATGDRPRVHVHGAVSGVREDEGVVGQLEAQLRCELHAPSSMGCQQRDRLGVEGDAAMLVGLGVLLPRLG